MKSPWNSTKLLGALVTLTWLGACSDNSGPCSACPPPPEGVFVSDPVRAAVLTAETRTALALAPDAADDVAYVALAPGTVPTGSRAIVRRVGDAASVTTAVTDGGFDPVPVVAEAGDSIEVRVTDVSGATLREVRVAVAVARPPIIVRTDPPPRKRDVPLNAAMVIVFSEPVSGGTINSSSVQLFRGTTLVAGTVSLLGGSATAAVFTPDAPLTASTDYQLIVTQAVRDLTGDALEAGVTVELTTGITTVGPVTRVTVLPDTVAIEIGSQVQVTAAARDTNGTPVIGRPVTWTSDNPAVATVSATGLVTALAEGVARVRGESDGKSGEAAVIVSSRLAPVDSVSVIPDFAVLIVGGLVELAAVLRDSAGAVLPFRQVTWSTSDPTVATVEAVSAGKAIVTAVSSGTATITATSEGKSGSARIAMGSPVTFVRLTTGQDHTCGLTTNARAWCWGGNYAGELGNGTLRPTLVPASVAGGLTFSQIGANSGLGCALTQDGAAYCWGDNDFGRLGTGSATGYSSTPVAVSGGLAFAAVGVGPYDRVCGLTSSGAAYCWGHNIHGALGIGDTTGPEQCQTEPCSTVPAAVTGGLTFTVLAVGYLHTCALTATGAAYCWGWGHSGVLGDSTTTDHSSPVPVAGGHAFVALSAGWFHTCGLTSDGTAYCWGNNASGQLGVGTTQGPEFCSYPASDEWCSSVPVPVLGGLRFAQISGGGYRTCGVTLSGAAYCWGVNTAGGQDVVTPAAVPGGLIFTSVVANIVHSCGITVGGVAYCWGVNRDGQLGTGSTTNSSEPVRVAGQP